MAAPSIPNLLARRGGGRGGGRGGRSRRTGPEEMHASRGGASSDNAIQGTDNDAAVSRLSVVDLGYLDDPYAPCFVSGQATRRLPIINRGTYMRTRALDTMIAAFLSHNGPSPKQIISLGAGTDTRPLHLLQRDDADKLIYHEIDFEPTCVRKRSVVQSAPSLRHIIMYIKPSEEDETGSWSGVSAKGGEYYCHARDLRKLDELPPAVRTDVPTLLLSECCLCYLTSEDANSVLRLFSVRIPNLATLLYEPMPLNDAFGDMMLSNLKARGILMPSLDKCRDAQEQLRRLRDAGFISEGHATIEDAWDNWVSEDERERVDGLEGLDEVEEWKLLAAHYVVVWGAKGDASFGTAPTT